MGEAYSAVADDVFALGWNPAGLNQLREPQLALMHNEWSSSLGLRQEYLAYGQRTGMGGIAVAVNYFSLGELEKRTTSGALDGAVGGYDISGSLGWGFALAKNVDAGLNLEYGMESLYGTSSSAYGGGLGLNWRALSNVNIAVAALHLGAASGGFSTPGQANVGVAADFFKRSLLFAVEGSKGLNDEASAGKAGMEWWLFDLLALRGGYRSRFGAPEGDLGSGLTAGLGIKYGILRVDYAYVPYGTLSTTHRLAAMLNFPADLFGPRVVISDKSGTIAAALYFQQGTNHYKNKDLLEALMSFRQAVQADPKHAKAKLMIDKVKKELEDQQRSGGENPEVKRLIERHMNEGLKFYNAGDMKRAIQEWEAVLDLDKTYNTAIAYMRKARAKLDETLINLRGAAAGALARGDLKTAVRNYREILRIDPINAEAKAKMAALQPRIIAEVKKDHRRGIDLYVAGKVKEAIKVWRDAREMTAPDDPDQLQRDIDKAQKLLELRGEN
jgi:Tfp pilus assembly protein PilF